MKAVLDLVNVLADQLPAGWRVLPFGPDGAAAVTTRGINTSLIVSRADHDGMEITHASIAHPDHDPTYAELAFLHRVAFGSGWAYQCFAAPDLHINIHSHALHLWRRTDGQPMLPNFGAEGTI